MTMLNCCLELVALDHDVIAPSFLNIPPPLTTTGAGKGPAVIQIQDLPENFEADSLTFRAKL